MTKTLEEEERMEEEPERHRQSLQESEGQDQPSEDDLKQVAVEPYFPEIFLG